MKRTVVFGGVIALLLLLSSCGPSAEQIATMTASAWTPTPLSTSTPIPPTPVPYDLTVSVTDESGAPIAGASIVFPESGDGKPVQSDDAGKFAWSNLPGEAVTLNVSAQGYLSNTASQTVVRGQNTIVVTLKRDSFGLLPSEACAAGEKLLYAEDFQDGRAQGWNEIDLKTPGWGIDPAAEVAGNIILSAHYSEMLGDSPLNSRLSDMAFDNAVWRVHFLISKPFPAQNNWFSFNWRSALEPFDLNGQQVFDSRYQLPVGLGYFALRRLQQPVTNVGIGQVKNPSFGDWHLVEIATYQGTTDVWIDGQRAMSYQDPQVIPLGGIGLELWLKGSDVIVYFDNMSVCELSAPFQPLATAIP